MEEVEVPSYFLCPISLEIMRDPVTLATGITYDRESIERWIFSEKHETCPATKQPLTADLELIPNHTLRRLIQAWCTANASHGIERFPTPRRPVDKAQIAALLDEAKLRRSRMVITLRKLKAIISESDRNKRCVEASGAADFLASVIKEYNYEWNQRDQQVQEEFDGDESSGSTTTATDEALSVLYSLQLSEQSLLHLIERNDGFIESLTTVLRRSNYQSRAHAMLLIKSLVRVMAPARLKGFGKESLEEVVKVLGDRISSQATKAALQVLGGLGPWGRNRVKAVEAGAVRVVIELLLEIKSEKRECEMMLVVLDQVCRCAEGRAEMVGHSAGIAVVTKKLLRVSRLASEKVVRILHSVAMFSPTPAVLQEMRQVGAVAKLCMLLQMDCGAKAREKAKEILMLHSKVWRNSLCLPPPLLASYPC